MIREQDWAYIQYGEDAKGGIELFDMRADPRQYTNLAESPEHREQVTRLRAKLDAKLAEVRTNDLPKQ